MEKINVVRADFYSNGEIVPLGITDSWGKTKYINRVLKTERRTGAKGGIAYQFVCEINEEKIILFFRNGQWELGDVKSQ